MDLVTAWALFPMALALTSVGCGLAFEALLGIRVPGALVPAIGFGLITVAGEFLTLAAATAELTVPVMAAVAVAGFGLAWLTGRALRPPPFLLVALGLIFAIYAAPVVASGAPTVAGFIRLDDTATWLAFTDHLLEDGRDLSALAPSTYETTLAVNIGEGYPVGAFVGLGVGSELLGLDPAFAIQPYMAYLAVLLALALWALARPLAPSRPILAGTVFLAAQPALLYGYYLWGGVKEVAAAALIATTAAALAFALGRLDDWRPLAPVALLTGALIGVLSVGGVVWVMPMLLLALVVLLRSLPVSKVALRAAGFAAAVLFMALPVIGPGGILPPTSSPLSDAEAKGNLIEPLDPIRVAGIWPAGDFRLPPVSESFTYVLVALALTLALGGGWWIVRRRALGLGLLAAGVLAGGMTFLVAGSPWVDGKTLATGSPFVLLAALAGCLALADLARPWLGIAAGIVLGAGVLWSTALAYRDVNLAPYEQFEELREIGESIAGEGPTLMTEYSPFGARHFLRDGEPEAVSELRRRAIPRADGSTVMKGLAADTDELDPEALAVYRTLVLRRSPGQSRPPGVYELVSEGRFYEVWQRAEGAQVLGSHLALGAPHDPIARPRCADVLDLAASASALRAAGRPAPLVIRTEAMELPVHWRPGPGATVVPDGAGELSARVIVPTAGEYEVWLGGSARPAVELEVDGEPVSEVRHELNNEGQYVSFGSVVLGAGAHTVTLRFHGPDLHPGSGGRAAPVGPLVLSSAEAAETRLLTISAEDAEELCGRRWDWIEAF